MRKAQVKEYIKRLLELIPSARCKIFERRGGDSYRFYATVDIGDTGFQFMNACEFATLIQGIELGRANP